jgi:hypothetical protein
MKDILKSIFTVLATIVISTTGVSVLASQASSSISDSNSVLFKTGPVDIQNSPTENLVKVECGHLTRICGQICDSQYEGCTNSLPKCVLFLLNNNLHQSCLQKGCPGEVCFDYNSKEWTCYGNHSSQSKLYCSSNKQEIKVYDYISNLESCIHLNEFADSNIKNEPSQISSDANVKIDVNPKTGIPNSKPAILTRTGGQD